MADGNSVVGRKRRRVDGEGGMDRDDDRANNFTKHDKFWFKDGNVILLCAQTGFRVHQSLLTLHSTVFQDMFVVATPGDADEGVPIVHLSDNPVKIARLLGFFYFHEEIPNVIGPLLDFFEISSKYDVSLIRDTCLARLRRAFPDTLSEFQETYHMRSDELETNLSDALRCLTLATAQGLHLLLPAISLVCADHHLFDTATKGVKLDALLGSLDLPSSLHSDLTLWSQKLLSEKRLKLDKYIQEFLQDPERQLNYHCAQALGIAFLSYTYQTFEGRDYLRYEHDLDIFAPDMYAVDLAKNTENICYDCTQMWQNKEQEGRNEIWDALPSYFSLGTWEELRAMDKQSYPTDDTNE